MTDNFEDFEHPEVEQHEDQSKIPTGFRANLSGAWRSQPLFKLFVLMVVVGAVVAVVVSLFSGGNGKSGVNLLRPPDMHEAPGGKSSPYLKEQTEMANKQRTEEAIQSGGSALPTPIGPGTDSGELNPAAPKEDPLNELRAEVENMNKQLQEAKQAAAAPPPAPAPPEPFDDSLAQAMQRQMGQMLDSWAPKNVKNVAVYDLDLLNRERQQEQEKLNQEGGAGGSSAGGDSMVGTDGAAASGKPGGPNAKPVKTILAAGTVSYAQLLIEANSDVQGPIMAQVVSGPLNGARVVGEFKVASGYSDYLTLTFKLANLKGVDYRINAIALDPDTTLGGMATEVNHRYLERVVLPAAAGFLQGFSSALGQGNSSISTNGSTTIIQQSDRSVTQGEYNGLSNAAQTVSQFLQAQANLTKTLVRVAAGTPMGLFFIDTVTDAPVQASQGNNPNGAAQQAGYPPYNQPYGSSVQNTGGYPVLYPNAAQNGLSYNNSGYGNTSYGGFGVSSQSGGGGYYPGSSVYYTH